MRNPCKHTETRTIDTRGYTGTVAVHPYTHENPVAHGGVRFTDECLDCGAKRYVNSNGQGKEYSPWRKPEEVRS